MARSNPESTVVFRMLDDFNSLITKHGEKSKKPALSRNVIKHLNFEDSDLSQKNLLEPTVHFDSVYGSPVSETSPLVSKERTCDKRKLEMDLMTTKNQLAKTQEKLSVFEIEAKRAKIEYERQLAMKLDQQQDENSGLHNVRLQLSHSIEKETEAKKELTELRRSYELVKNDYEQRLNALQREKDELKGKLEDQLSESNEAVFTLKSDLHRLKVENSGLKSDKETTEEQLKKYTQRSIDVITHMHEAENAKEEAKRAKQRLAELEKELQNSGDAGKLVKILEGQLTNKKELEKENLQLKESNRILSMREENILLLKEELLSSKKQTENLEKKAQLVVELKLENEDLKHKLSGWESLAKVGSQQSGSPQSVAKAIAKLQEENTLLTEKVGNLSSNNKALEKAKHNLEENLNKANAENNGSKLSLKQSTDQIRHLQRKLFLVSKERDACREIMDNYSKDCTIISSDVQENERVKKLETILDGYKRTTENLETDLKSAHDQLKRFGHLSNAEAEEERNKMKNDIKMLTSKVSNFESDIAQLQEEKKMLELRIEYDTLKGEVNPLKTRLVHLSSNPVNWARQQRAAEMESLKTENATLKQRIIVLEEATAGQVANVTMTVEEKLKQEPSSKVVKELEDNLRAAEAKNKRIMEACRQLSSEFREVTYTLLGYNIELKCTGQYKLSNMYSESPSDYLLFAKADNGELQLLETPFSSSLKEKIELYLHTHNSIPAFLSNLTMELFHSQTSVFSVAGESSKCRTLHDDRT